MSIIIKEKVFYIFYIKILLPKIDKFLNE